MRTKNKSRKTTVKKPIKRRKSKSFAQKVIMTWKSLFILIVLSIAMVLYINSESIFKNLYQFSSNSGFVVKKISIVGNHHMSTKQIYNSLKIKKGEAILAISLSAVKNNLENWEWIKEVTVERLLPDLIKINVVERTPIALGQKDRKLYIIDDEGVIINTNKLGPYLSLPIIIGDGAEIYASSLINILKTDPILYKRISSIIRVSEYRWNIRFDNELEVKLPDENVERAWKKIIKMNKDKMLFLPENSAVDLRISNKIYIEKR